MVKKEMAEIENDSKNEALIKVLDDIDKLTRR